MHGFKMVTFRERPELERPGQKLISSVWPEFMLHDPVSNRYWSLLTDKFADFQFVLLDEKDQVVAMGNSIPVAWGSQAESLPERGWDAIMEQGFYDRETGRTPTVLSALAAAVASDHQGQGLSQLLVEGMRVIAARQGMRALIAPVRPTLKSQYPLTPMENYVQWQQSDGAPFDPWLRVHWKLGGKFLRIAPASMIITGTIADWEEWSGLRFPESGRYVIPGALEPVRMDCEQDLGIYVEPNVWMSHTISN